MCNFLLFSQTDPTRISFVRMWTDLEHGAWQNLRIVAQPLNLRRRLSSERALEYDAATFCHRCVLKWLDKLRLANSCKLYITTITSFAILPLITFSRMLTTKQLTLLMSTKFPFNRRQTTCLCLFTVDVSWLHVK